jgi:hypothetical protein
MVVLLAIFFSVMLFTPHPQSAQLEDTLPAHSAEENPKREISITPEEIPLPEPTAPPLLLKKDPSIGVYLTANSIARSDKFFHQTMEEVVKLPHPTLVIDVKESAVFYHSSSPLAQELGTVQSTYDLSLIVREARKRGIHTIARFVAAKDRSLAVKRSDTHIRHPLTGKSIGGVWVDLSNELVLEYNQQLLKEVIAAGVDEVNIDYIRYPTEYTPEQIGLSGVEKSDRVETFIRMARETIDAINPQAKLGISTYAILGLDYAVNVDRLGQDVVRFAPLVDIISPMAYPASFASGYRYRPVPGKSRMYSLVYRTLDGYSRLLGEGHRHKIRPWIQGYRVREIDMRDQIQASFDAGACGFTVWSPSNLYGPLYAAMEELSVPAQCGNQS